MFDGEKFVGPRETAEHHVAAVLRSRECAQVEEREHRQDDPNDRTALNGSPRDAYRDLRGSPRHPQQRRNQLPGKPSKRNMEPVSAPARQACPS
jgi:hypothetical protein